MKRKNVLILLAIISIVLTSLFIFLIFNKDVKLVLNGKSNISLDVNETFEDEKVNACYGNIFKCKKIAYTTYGIVDSTKLGTYKIKYSVSYNNKSKKVTRTIKVIDKQKPKLDIKTQEFYVCPNGNLNKYEYTATDNYDNDLTEKVNISLEYDKLIFSVSDSSNNITMKSFNYIKEDKEKPIIKLNGAEKVFVLLGDVFKESGYVAQDNCDGDLTNNVKVTSSVDTSKTGTYKIKYEVTDESGNQSLVYRTVVVYQKNVVVEPKDGTIYLTFDDGPGPYTAKLLDVLKKHNVKATFFVTNQYPDYTDMITRAYNEGHSIALHTYTHNYAQVYSSIDGYFSDLYNIDLKIKNATNGYESKLVRFPGGSSNVVSKKYMPGIMTSLAQELDTRGYKYFDWNVDSDDAGRARSPEEVYQNVVSGLKSGGYSVVLQHDVKEYSVDAVEKIIEYGQTHGFTFKGLDITSPTAHHGINN